MSLPGNVFSISFRGESIRMTRNSITNLTSFCKVVVGVQVVTPAKELLSNPEVAKPSARRVRWGANELNKK